LEVRIGITVSGREPGGLLKRGALSNSVEVAVNSCTGRIAVGPPPKKG